MIPIENNVPESTIEIGRILLENGAEVNRVEDTIARICSAYGVKADVFALPNFIAVTYESTTLTARVRRSRINLSMIERINNLSRHICKTKPSDSEIRKKLSHLPHSQSPFRLPLAYICACAALTANYGGDLRDIFTASLISLIIMLIKEHSASNRIVKDLLMSFSVGAAQYIASLFIPHLSAENIISACVILMIPGFSFTTSIKDMLYGDTIAGILRFCEAFLSSIAIASGIAMSEFICSYFL